MVTLALAAALAAPPSLDRPPGNAACLDCHAQAVEHVQAVDPKTYSESPHAVLSCERCHAEAATPDHAKNPEKPLGLPKDQREKRVLYSSRCVKCHAGIPQSYNPSFHGKAVASGDNRAATCVDCHGVHNIFPQSDARALTNPANLAGTCGSQGCHQGAPANFANGKEHVTYTKAAGTGTDQVLHYIWKFFIALILFDTMKDGPIVMFELLRRIRG